MTQNQQLIQFLQYLDANPLASLFFLFLMIWSLAWKGVALWKSARNNQTPWFIFLLVINTLGILEIIYILFFSKKNQQA